MMPMSIIAIVTVFIITQTNIVSSCTENCKCRNERVIICHHGFWENLPEDINPEVEQLDFSYNFFTSIPNGISQYKELKKIIFAYNRIDSLGSHLLVNLDHLESLDLAWNAFTRSSDLDPSALARLPSLKELNLSNNDLKTFPQCGSSSLEDINLENCSISGLNPGVLGVFPKLKSLNLAMNNIQSINKQFQSKTLQVFNLTQCQIERVTSTALDKLKALTHLYLSKNYQLKSFTANSSSLKFLDLRDCNLESVPKGWLPNLTTLDLSFNHLRRIEAGWFRTMPKLRELNLRANSIDTIAQDSFEQMMDLDILDLSHNTFTSLDFNIFNQNENLKMVNMSRTYINKIIPLQSRSLVVLDLTNCEIGEIKWNSLMGMAHLERLYLSGNLINEIPLNLTSVSLINLDLSNNRLSVLKNSTFRMVPRLNHLNLVGNRLVHLEFYSSFKGIRSFFVGDNPWRCECTNKGFEMLFKTLDQINSDVENARCQAPQNLEGKTWGEACGPEWFPWNFAQGDKAWIVSVTLMAVFVISCCLFVSINRECNRRKKRQREEEAVVRSDTQQRLLAMIHASRVHLEEESRNAPDPRELQGPPSYNDAITMPPLGSTASLYSRKEEPLGSPSINGSVNTLNSITNLNQNNNLEEKQKKRRKKRPKSPHRLNRMSQASQESSQISDPNQSSSQMSYARSISHVSEMTQSNPDLLDKSGRPLSAKTKRRRRRSRTRSQNLGESSSDAETSVIETNM